MPAPQVRAIVVNMQSGLDSSNMLTKSGSVPFPQGSPGKLGAGLLRLVDWSGENLLSQHEIKFNK